MSIDFSVYVDQPLEVASVMRETSAVLRELLQVQDIPDLQVEEFREGVRLDAPSTIMSSDTGGFVLSLSGKNPVATLVFDTEEADSTPTWMASVSVYGAGGAPQKLVMGIACSVAIARLARSRIDSISFIGWSDTGYEADELVAQVKCRRTYDDLEEAFAEVVSHINTKSDERRM